MYSLFFEPLHNSHHFISILVNLFIINYCSSDVFMIGRKSRQKTQFENLRKALFESNLLMGFNKHFYEDDKNVLTS